MKVRDVKETIARRQRFRMIAAAVIFFIAIAAVLMGYVWSFILLLLLGGFFVSSYLYCDVKTPRKARTCQIARVIFGSLIAVQIAVTGLYFFLIYWGGR